MKEQILAKIAEMNDEIASAYQKVEAEMEQNNTEYTDEMTGSDPYLLFLGYDGESCGHVLDVLEEQMYVLGKLKRFIEGLEA